MKKYVIYNRITTTSRLTGEVIQEDEWISPTIYPDMDSAYKICLADAEYFARDKINSGAEFRFPVNWDMESDQDCVYIWCEFEDVNCRAAVGEVILETLERVIEINI